MRWILFFFVCLVSLPTQAVTIPGVTTPTSTHAQTAPAKSRMLNRRKRPTAHWLMCWKMTPRARN